MNQFNDIEIMAPVGCWESLAAALEAGATSVYFGIEYGGFFAGFDSVVGGHQQIVVDFPHVCRSCGTAYIGCQLDGSTEREALSLSK